MQGAEEYVNERLLTWDESQGSVKRSGLPPG